MQVSKEGTDLHMGNTKLRIYKRMAQQRRASSSGQGSAVHLRLKDKSLSFQGSQGRQTYSAANTFTLTNINSLRILSLVEDNVAHWGNKPHWLFKLITAQVSLLQHVGVK